MCDTIDEKMKKSLFSGFFEIRKKIENFPKVFYTSLANILYYASNNVYVEKYSDDSNSGHKMLRFDVVRTRTKIPGSCNMIFSDKIFRFFVQSPEIDGGTAKNS